MHFNLAKIFQDYWTDNRLVGVPLVEMSQVRSRPRRIWGSDFLFLSVFLFLAPLLTGESTPFLQVGWVWAVGSTTDAGGKCTGKFSI